MRKSEPTTKTKAPAQIKSKQRVRERGEVFTAEREVKAMCDLIPEDEIWSDITKTFLEPACGTGNFLVEIFGRKLQYCKDERDGLKALASIIGIDIAEDNCFEARVRLMTMYCKAFPKASKASLLLAAGILRNNIICGDSLEIQKKWIEENKKSENNTLPSSAQSKRKRG